MLVWTGLAGITGGSALLCRDHCRRLTVYANRRRYRKSRFALPSVTASRTSGQLERADTPRGPPGSPLTWTRPSVTASAQPIRPVASASQVSGAISTTFGGVPLVCRGPGTHWIAPYGGTRTSTDRPGARSARTANSDTDRLPEHRPFGRTPLVERRQCRRNGGGLTVRRGHDGTIRPAGRSTRRWPWVAPIQSDKA